MVEQSKARFCGRSLAGIAVWNFTACCKCYVLSGSGPCDGPIPRLEGPYGLWCVVESHLETWKMRRPWPQLGCYVRKKKRLYSNYTYGLSRRIPEPNQSPTQVYWTLYWAVKSQWIKTFHLQLLQMIKKTCSCLSFQQDCTKWCLFKST